MASLFFFLIAANNLIKIVRDTVFLSHHSESELPYVYILVALVSGAVIVTYTRYTAKFSITKLMLATNIVITANIVFFWFLRSFFDTVWGPYAFYIWSAMVGAIAVAQFWTFATDIFTPEEGRRIFGLVAAGGTLGGVAAGFGTKWAVERFLQINDLLWVLAAIFFASSIVVFQIHRWLRGKSHERESTVSTKTEEIRAINIGSVLASSRFLKTIAMLILLSVIVSTLIDFQFKTGAKQAHTTSESLAGFFSAYYAWLSVAVFFAQVVLTRKALRTLGLIPTLYLTPGTLLAGALGIMIWPGVFAAALTRMASAALRNSVQRSSMEILYMSVPRGVRIGVKTFLDVVVERIGDATAGFIILVTFFFSGTYIIYVHWVCVALILVWMFLIPLLRIGYSTTS